MLEFKKMMQVEEMPVISTNRLVLDEIKQKDSDIYQQICLDDERNKYWGYDYREDLKEEYKDHLPEDYFFKVVQFLFENRMSLSLAIRRNTQMIGEVVLYNADYSGGIEIGCRILKEYEGCGYGREAMRAAADWALYEADFTRVKAKCYKENTASFRMLSSFMSKIGEDETFYYFEIRGVNRDG